MEKNKYDLIIIGAGPAGITGAIYAARKQINVLVVTKDIGGQAAWSSDVENYTGFQVITGVELIAKFEEHMQRYKVPIKENESVIDIVKNGADFTVKTDKGTHKTRALVIATGKRSRELGVPGEVKFKNKGVAYCATCDGPLFSGKDIAVIGGGNSALDAAISLSKIAKKVYLITNIPALTGDHVLRETLQKFNTVQYIYNAQVTEIVGDSFVNGIKIKVKGKEQVIPVQGVFIEIGFIPNAHFISIVKKNDLGEIMINCAAETNIPGIFAAGDVTTVPDKQIIIAAGEGSKAVLSAYRYLLMPT